MTAPARPRRADALRNAEKVLESAHQVFAEMGMSAGVDEVALRAGVGKATVYRCYATKAELLAAVAGARVLWFTGLVLDAIAADDAWTGFRQLLRTTAESHAQNALLIAGLGAVVETAELQSQRTACRTALQQLLDRAKAQGSMRTDATAGHVMVLLCGVSRTLIENGEQDLDVWRSYADLVANAFRA